jgi:hypothetical protein
MITTRNGRRYAGATAEAAVVAMWHDAPFTEAASLAEYMAGCAFRAYEWNRSTVRFSSAEVFLLDMAQAGLLTVSHVQ